MEINPTQQEVLERAKTLPEAMKEAYFSENSSLSIGRVMEKNSLNVEEGRMLADTVGLVLLGYVPLQNFVSELISQLNIDRDKAERILHDVDDEIFSSLKQFLTNKEKPRDETREQLPTKAEGSVMQSGGTQHTDFNTERIKQLLRDNTKTVSIKNLIANLK